MSEATGHEEEASSRAELARTRATAFMRAPRSLYGWALSYLRPYKLLVGSILGVSGLEVVLGVLKPWPLKVLVDNVLAGQRRLPLLGDVEPADALLLGCAAYFVLHVLTEINAAVHTQLQVGIGQRIVADLRQALFAHLQACSRRS